MLNVELQTNPYNEPYYRSISDGSRRSAAVVMPMVQDMQRLASVVDFGCGSGEWLSILPSLGVTDYIGVDGDWCRWTNPWFRVGDLRKPIDLDRKFDLVISVEVAEHLPESAAETYIETLCRHGDRILFSAGVPCQIGTDHINLQWPTYWSALFRKHGFGCSDVLRIALWENTDVEWWYRQNLLYVTKGESSHEPMRLVHPELLKFVYEGRR